MRQSRYHMIDLLFTIALFCMFAASSLVVVMIGANIYQSINEKAEQTYQGRTSLAYITQKIRQNDTEGGVSLGEFQGAPALTLTSQINGETYHTYIYFYEQEMKELFLESGTPATLGDGQTIMAVQDFTMEQLHDGLFRFAATETNGRRTECQIGVRSGS